MAAPSPILNYAGPQVDPNLPEAASTEKWFLLLRRPSADLPPRCVICNRQVQTPLRQTKLYHTRSPFGFGYLLPFGNHLVGSLVIVFDWIQSLFARPVVEVSYALCPRHLLFRRGYIVIHGFFSLFSVLFFSAAIYFNLGNRFLRPAAALLALYLLIPVRPRRLLRVVGSNRGQVVLVGPRPVFLKSIPDDDLQLSE